jgi:hypothetical protein
LCLGADVGRVLLLQVRVLQLCDLAAVQVPEDERLQFRHGHLVDLEDMVALFVLDPPIGRDQSEALLHPKAPTPGDGICVTARHQFDYCVRGGQNPADRPHIGSR